MFAFSQNSEGKNSRHPILFPSGRRRVITNCHGNGAHHYSSHFCLRTGSAMEQRRLNLEATHVERRLLSFQVVKRGVVVCLYKLYLTYDYRFCNETPYN